MTNCRRFGYAIADGFAWQPEPIENADTNTLENPFATSTEASSTRLSGLKESIEEFEEAVNLLVGERRSFIFEHFKRGLPMVADRVSDSMVKDNTRGDVGWVAHAAGKRENIVSRLLNISRNPLDLWIK